MVWFRVLEQQWGLDLGGKARNSIDKDVLMKKCLISLDPNSFMKNGLMWPDECKQRIIFLPDASEKNYVHLW